jgi:hypothetical protein
MQQKAEGYRTVIAGTNIDIQASAGSNRVSHNKGNVHETTNEGLFATSSPRTRGAAFSSVILVLGKSDPECPECRLFTARSHQTTLCVCAVFVAKLAYDNANT